MKTEYRVDGRLALLLGIAVLACIGMFWVPAIPQDPAYHDFADRSRWFGVPNFRNVESMYRFFIAPGRYFPHDQHTILPSCGENALRRMKPQIGDAV